MALSSIGNWDIKMNSFETDLKRALCSKGFAAGLAIELLILIQAGFDSDLFRMGVPIIAALPYSTAWLLDYQSGYIKAYLPRTSIAAYIGGKFLSCGISGGLAQAFGCSIYMLIKEDTPEINLLLIFTSGMLWAVLSTVLAAWSNSRYIAYGGGFVLYYVLVILHQRYFEHMYCLNPYEWLSPSHTWILGDWGAVLMLFGMILVLLCIYYEIVRRRMEHV